MIIHKQLTTATDLHTLSTKSAKPLSSLSIAFDSIFCITHQEIILIPRIFKDLKSLNTLRFIWIGNEGLNDMKMRNILFTLAGLKSISNLYLNLDCVNDRILRSVSLALKGLKFLLKLSLVLCPSDEILSDKEIRRLFSVLKTSRSLCKLGISSWYPSIKQILIYTADLKNLPWLTELELSFYFKSYLFTGDYEPIIDLCCTLKNFKALSNLKS